MTNLTLRISGLSELAPADLEELKQGIRARMDTPDLRAGFNRGLIVAAASFYHLAAVKRFKGHIIEAKFCEELAVLLAGQGVEEPEGCGLPDVYAAIASGGMEMPAEFQHG